MVFARDGTTIGLADAVTISNYIFLHGYGVKLDVAGSDSATLNGDILQTGTGFSLEKTGTGTLVLGGAVNYSGPTTVSAGTLEIANVQATFYNSDYTVASGATLAIDGNLGFVDIGSLSGAGSVAVGSNSDLYVGGVGDNTSNTTFSGDLTVDSLTYDGGGTLTLTGSSNNVSFVSLCACIVSGGITVSDNTMTTLTTTVESGTFTVDNGANYSTFVIDDQGKVVIDHASTVSVVAGGGGAVVVTGSATEGASLVVKGGSSLTSDALVIFAGDPAWPVPTATISGAGTTVASDNVLVGGPSGGGFGGGVLTVSDGASLTTINDIFLQSGAVLNIGTGGTAGIVNAPSITGDSGAEQMIANFSGTGSLGAVVGGDLSLTKQGSGTLTLSGANTYTGTTTIAGGTLQIGDGTAGAITPGAITDNGTLAINLPTPTTLTNTVSGTGGLTQMGSGKLTLNDAKTYTGVTAIGSGSTLALTGAGSLATSREVAADGTLDGTGIGGASIDIKSLSGSGMVLIGAKRLNITAGAGVFSGDITDNGAGGSLSVTGNQVLSGTNTFSGGMAVGPGTLTVSNPASLGTGTIAFAAGSILKFAAAGTYNQAANFALGAPIYNVDGTTVTWAGQMTGPGDLAVTGNGTLVLTNAANSYAGGTEIYGGSTLRVDADGELGAPASILQLGDATTKGTLQYAGGFTLNAARTVTLMAGGGVIDTQGFNPTIAQPIGGSGGLTKTGSGTLTLAGVSTYSGPTTVAAGTLAVNGSIASAVTVASGARLGGTGTVGATTIAPGGMLAPGNSIGTLRVNGNLTLASGSSFAAEVSPTAADQVSVTGTASLNGTLAIAQGAGTYTGGTSLKLISAASVSGTFANVTGASFAGLNSTILYSATGVDLLLATPAGAPQPGGGAAAGGGGAALPAGGGGGTVTTAFAFNTYGKTVNQIAAGAALAAGSPTAPLATSAGALVAANVAGVPALLGQLSGDIHASLRSAAIEDSRIIRDTVLDHMAGHGDGITVWGAGFGGYGSISGDGNTSGLHHDTAGFIAGADMALDGGLRVGLAGAYSANAARVADASARASGGSGHLIAYGGWSNDAIDLKLGGDFGWGSADVTRAVSALGQANSDREDQQSNQIFAQAGYRFATDLASLEPYVGIAGIWAQSGAFAETGGTSALSGAARTESQAYSTVGLRAALAPVESLGGIVPHVDLGWQHGFDQLRPGQTLTFQNVSQSFTVLGVPLAQDAAALRGGFAISLSPQATLSLDYDGSFSSRVQNNALRGAVEWKF